MSRGAPSRGMLAIAIGGSILAVSTAAVLLRYSESPAITKAFYRLAYATLALLPFAVWKARDDLRALRPRDWLGLGAIGVVLAVHFAAWITSLDMTSVASSVVLVTLHPVFVALASEKLFGEGPTRMGYVGILVALGGGVLIAFGDSQGGAVGSDPLLGDALALVGAAAAAVYFLAGRGYRKRLGLLAYVTPVYAASAVTLAMMAFALDQPLAVGEPREHALFVALALAPMIAGHTVLNWALKYVPAPVIATTIVGEPVGATILTFFLLGETPAWLTLLGGGIVLAGIMGVALTSGEAARPRRLPRAPE